MVFLGQSIVFSFGMAVLHEERKLELNADCAEFCPFPGHQDLLAVGTYQLDEQKQQRHGRLHLFRNVQHQRLSSTQVATLDCAGAHTSETKYQRNTGSCLLVDCCK